jgi:hypothetical protein
MLQGLVASLIFYTATAPFPGLYVLLRYDSWPLAWFSSVVFWLLCVYLTLVSVCSSKHVDTAHACTLAPSIKCGSPGTDCVRYQLRQR